MMFNTEERKTMSFRLPSRLKIAMDLRLATSQEFRTKEDMISDILMKEFKHELDILEDFHQQVQDE